MGVTGDWESLETAMGALENGRPTILQRLPLPAILQPALPFSSQPYHSPATLCTFFLQILPFMLIHKPLFRLCPTEAIIVKSASIISNASLIHLIAVFYL